MKKFSVLGIVVLTVVVLALVVAVSVTHAQVSNEQALNRSLRSQATTLEKRIGDLEVAQNEERSQESTMEEALVGGWPPLITEAEMPARVAAFNEIMDERMIALKAHRPGYVWPNWELEALRIWHENGHDKEALAGFERVRNYVEYAKKIGIVQPIDGIWKDLEETKTELKQ